MEEDKKKMLDAQQAKKVKMDATKAGRKRGRAQDGYDGDTQGKRLKGESGEPVPVEGENQLVFEQPALVTGAKLKGYQLEGLQWMVSLDQNGISGILGGDAF
jgi:ATP-dependent DNA helicase